MKNPAIAIRKEIKAHYLLKNKKIVVGENWVDVDTGVRVQAFTGRVPYYVTLKGTDSTFPCKNLREVVLTLIGIYSGKK